MNIGLRSRTERGARVSAGSFGEAKLKVAGVALLSVVLGCAYAYLVVGRRVINPTNLSWISGDPATSYLGWAFLRQQSNPGFPIGWSNAIGYPLGEPIGYLDSMPLLALVSWLFRGVLPQNFQYLGPWFVVCAVLQFYFGYRISRRVCRSELSAVLGGILFLTAPVFTWRASGHFTLLSQWLILAGVDLLLGAKTGLSRRAMVWSVVLCFLAASTHPYIAVMTLLVCSAAQLRAVLTGGSGLFPAALAAVASGVAMAAGFLLFGFFLVGSDTSLYAGQLYELTSMNLLSVVDPQRWGSILLKAQPNISDYQYEGYNYLGLGIILLGVIVVARSPAVMGSAFSRSALPMVGVVVISLLLAVSTKGTFGSQVIYNVKLPRRLMMGLEAFRASGRLFWPGYYLLFVAVLAATTRVFPRRWLPAVLGITVLVQFADGTGLRTAIQEAWERTTMPTRQNPVWRELGREHRHLVNLPAYQCGMEETPGGPLGYAIFGKIAADQHMTTNSFYAGRYSNTQLQYFCIQQPLELQRDGMAADTAYVFPPSRGATVSSLNLNGHYCRLVDDTILCSRVPGKVGLDPTLAREVQELARDTVVSFQGESEVTRQVLGEGWSVPELWGRWSLGPTSNLTFRIREPEKPLRVTYWVKPFLTPKHPQRIGLRVNGEKLAEWTVTKSGDQALSVEIPQRVIPADGLVRMDFQFPDAISPQLIGAGSDSRFLAIGLMRMQLGD